MVARAAPMSAIQLKLSWVFDFKEELNSEEDLE